MYKFCSITTAGITESEQASRILFELKFKIKLMLKIFGICEARTCEF